ncbi:MAG: hypothetical protein JOY96_08255 [Verrucomicrobia bacterium]|nr:hypothetical protein [Verrucomicrobiota bacterium]
MALSTWPWFALILLGAWHGLNPGMGWLFSVALGLQQKSRAGVLQSLIPIAFGHGLAIGLVVLAILGADRVLPFRFLQWAAGALLLAIAFWKLWRGRHPGWVGMRVGFWDLTGWSWLMASAHGAGLMIVPVLLAGKATFCGAAPVEGWISFNPLLTGIAVLVHTGSHMVVSGVMAWTVYNGVGVAILRNNWINLDLIWACSLFVVAFTLFVMPPSS